MEIQVTFEIAAEIENARHSKSMLEFYDKSLQSLTRKYAGQDGRSRGGKQLKACQEQTNVYLIHYTEALIGLGKAIADCDISNEDLHQLMEDTIINKQ